MPFDRSGFSFIKKADSPETTCSDCLLFSLIELNQYNKYEV